MGGVEAAVGQQDRMRIDMSFPMEGERADGDALRNWIWEVAPGVGQRRGTKRLVGRQEDGAGGQSSLGCLEVGFLTTGFGHLTVVFHRGGDGLPDVLYD